MFLAILGSDRLSLSAPHFSYYETKQACKYTFLIGPIARNQTHPPPRRSSALPTCPYSPYRPDAARPPTGIYIVHWLPQSKNCLSNSESWRGTCFSKCNVNCLISCLSCICIKQNHMSPGACCAVFQSREPWLLVTLNYVKDQPSEFFTTIDDYLKLSIHMKMAFSPFLATTFCKQWPL